MHGTKIDFLFYVSETLETNSSLTTNVTTQSFSFRELEAATRNFAAECLLGEGGSFRVYKGRLESTNQVCCGYLLSIMCVK